jgi:hypothetical protein
MLTNCLQSLVTHAYHYTPVHLQIYTQGIKKPLLQHQILIAARNKACNSCKRYASSHVQSTPLCAVYLHCRACSPRLPSAQLGRVQAALVESAPYIIAAPSEVQVWSPKKKVRGDIQLNSQLVATETFPVSQFYVYNQHRIRFCKAKVPKLWGAPQEGSCLYEIHFERYTDAR